MGKRRGKGKVDKGLPALANTGGRVTDLSGVAALLRAQQGAGIAEPLPRDQFPYSFGPGIPLQPAPLDPTRRDTGRAEPRLWQYPVTWNIHIPGQDNRLVPWQTLRDAADRIAILRDCIRVRKNEIISLAWDVTITQRAIETAQRENPSAKRIDLERDMRKTLGPQIDRCVEFWETPDRRNGNDFPTWISKILEEHLVLDAIAVYPRRTLGGDLYSLECLDGTTIKPLLDHTGGRPLPPQPAYQQVLWGFPRGEYVADTSEDGADPDGYAADQLIYRVKESRTTTPYGFSAVEQSLDDSDLWLKRMAWLKAEYTDGVMPAGWLKSDGSTGWTPDQLLGYESELNDYYSGLTKARMRWRMLPPGVEPVDSRQVDERYKPEYDLHLLKLVTAHFDMTIAELGFTEAKGLGSAGYHEGQENVQERKGTRPTLTWLNSVLTGISRTHLDMPSELEFKFRGLDEEDEAAADEVNRNRFLAGGITLNEWRDERGEPRYAFPEADMSMLVMQRGVVFPEGASLAAAPGVLVEPGGGPPGDSQSTIPPSGGPRPPQPAAGAGSGSAGFASPPTPPVPDTDPPAAKAAELAAYRRWAVKGRTRPFEFTTVTRVDAEAAGVDVDRAVFKAGGPDPKAEAAVWAAWEMDQKAAEVWAPRISQVFAGINTETLARRWRELRKTADSDSWLSEQHLPIVTRLGEVLAGVYGDGYVIGQKAASAALNVTVEVDWGGWEPGDPRAAREVAGLGLDRLLEQAQVTIRSIAANRITELGDVLADAVDGGWSVDQLAGVLRGVLDDPVWARMVAVTELNRATSYASQQQYLDAGVQFNEWLDVPGACVICRGNAAAGPVRIGHDFPSGATAPPAHPHCRCGVGPVRSELTGFFANRETTV